MVWAPSGRFAISVLPFPPPLFHGDNMTELTIDRKQLASLLSGFGNNVGDLRLVVTDETIGGAVAFMSHFLRKTETIKGQVKTKGALHISELAKVQKFVKSLKTDEVTIKQLGTTKPLYITAGGSKLQLPTSATIVSFSKVSLFAQLIGDAKKSEWTKFHNADLDVHGTVDLAALTGVTKMRGILNSSPVFRVVANAEEKEFTVTAGKKHEARLFSTAALVDAKGPGAPIESTFGAWLMQALALMRPQPAEIHFGANTVLVIEQGEDLLVVIDQRA